MTLDDALARIAELEREVARLQATMRDVAERLERYPVGHNMGLSMAHNQFAEELTGAADRLTESRLQEPR